MVHSKIYIDGAELVGLTKIDIFSYLDRDVAVLVDNEGKPWSDQVRVCLSPKSLEEQMIRFGKKAKTFTLGTIIQLLIQDERKHLFLYGFSLGDFVLEVEELKPLAYSIATFNLLHRCIKEKLSSEEAFDLLKERTFYYLGSPLLTDLKNPFHFDTYEKDGVVYIKLFFSQEAAEKSNFKHLQPVPINLERFKLFVGEKFAFIIEWNKSYQLKIEN